MFMPQLQSALEHGGEGHRNSQATENPTITRVGLQQMRIPNGRADPWTMWVWTTQVNWKSPHKSGPSQFKSSSPRIIWDAINKSVIMVVDFNTFLSDGTSGQQIGNIKDLDDTFEGLDLIDIYETFYSTKIAIIFSSHKTFTMIIFWIIK